MSEAEKIKQQNIIEYVLYMYHAEEIIRSCQFSVDLIRESILDPKAENKSERADLYKWYLELMEEMEAESLIERGHVAAVIDAIGELSYLHKILMTVTQDSEYKKLWDKTHPYLLELEKKSGSASRNPIELSFNGIFGVVLLKMRNQDPHPSTLEAVESFSEMLRYLGKKYKDIQEGRFKLPNTMQN